MNIILGCGRILIVVLNIIFLVISLAILAVGIAFRFFDTADVMSDMYTGLKGVLDELNIDSSVSNNISITDIDVLNSMAIACIIFGVFLFILAFSGCVGSCCKIRVLLMVYAIIILVLVIIQVAVFLFLYIDGQELISDKLKDSLKSYKGMNNGDVLSGIWNAVMIKLKCCGINSGADFKHSIGSWDFKITYGNLLITKNVDFPPACCKTRTAAAITANCASKLSNDNYYSVGCLDTAFEILENPLLFFGIIALVLIFQVLLIVCAFCMCRKIGKQNTQVGMHRKR